MEFSAVLDTASLQPAIIVRSVFGNSHSHTFKHLSVNDNLYSDFSIFIVENPDSFE
jgi:hypothetical protein